MLNQYSDSRRPLNVLLGVIVASIIALTAIAMIVLWPQGETVVQEPGVNDAAGVVVSAEVIRVTTASCADANVPPNDMGPSNGGAPVATDEECVEVLTVLESGAPVTVTLNGLQAELQRIQPGDQVQLIEYTTWVDGERQRTFAFYDHPRGGKMLLIAVVFVLIVIAVGRWRGVRALIGVGAAILLLTTFILPGILAGQPPVLIASVGALAIMIVVLYLAHGISHRTTAALFGSIFGIAFTAIIGVSVTNWLRFTGVASVEDGSLQLAVPGLDMNAVLTATIVIAGLGVLNDVTVAQASAVWEMRALNPHLPKRRIYLSAMRVGRDHIASSIYTLVFACAGAMLVVLLLLYTYPRDLIELVTSEQIGQELIRTLIGSAGLVLSMPVTTAFAVLFAEPANESTPSPSLAE